MRFKWRNGNENKVNPKDGDTPNNNIRNKNCTLEVQDVSSEDADSRVDHSTLRRSGACVNFEEDRDGGDEYHHGIRIVATSVA